MAERAYGGGGIARMYALIFGIAYLAVAVLELFFPTNDPLVIGGATIIAGGTVHIVIHFVVAALVLGSYFAGETAARMVARVVGIVFVVVSLLNIFAGQFYWDLVAGGTLQGQDAGTPVAYTLVHIATAAAALYGGFATRGYRAATA
jgi:hypothetical protein